MSRRTRRRIMIVSAIATFVGLYLIASTGSEADAQQAQAFYCHQVSAGYWPAFRHVRCGHDQ